MKPMPPSPDLKKLRKLCKEPQWQSGDYYRYVQWDGILPYTFILISKVTGAKPETIVSDFINNLSFDTWPNKGNVIAKQKLVDYFVALGYGQDRFEVEEIRAMFKELESIEILIPDSDNIKMLDMYIKWRKKYYKYWFKKWICKSDPRR